jgi:hypothetical protein
MCPKCNSAFRRFSKMGGRESRARAKTKGRKNNQGWIPGGSFALRNSSITDCTSSFAWTNS